MNTTLRRSVTAGRRHLRGLLTTVRVAGSSIGQSDGTRNGIRNGIPFAAVKGVGSADTPAEQPEQPEQPADLFDADELPPLADIATAAREYLRATEQARVADRAKRGARKLLDRLPAGRYGAWQVERVANAREVADLEAIRAIFDAYGLGEVPMKRVAPSLKVTTAAELANVAGLVAA